MYAVCIDEYSGEFGINESKGRCQSSSHFGTIQQREEV
jgi:hypothetical protein